MTVTGIICEYNPFHNGHAYHIKETRHICNSDYIIGVMSGDYVQRGEAAVTDKYTRTKMALISGCDIILELPVRYATSSAEGFACAAVNTIISTCITDNFCFGTEDGSLKKLLPVTDILYNEPRAYSDTLKSELKTGLSFPAARMKALQACTGTNDINYSPNNILAIEYLKACKNTKLKPYTIKRTDGGYNADDISVHPDNICSAGAIRKLLYTNDKESLINYMPFDTLKLLNNTVITNDFSDILYSQLIYNRGNLYDFLDVSDDMSSRISNNINSYKNFTDFCELIKTKQLTYTRVSRALLHICLGIKQYNQKNYDIPYIRLLGFRKDASHLIKKLCDNAAVPVLKNARDIHSLTAPFAKEMINEDIRCSELYRYIQGITDYNEYTHGLVIV